MDNRTLFASVVAANALLFPRSPVAIVLVNAATWSILRFVAFAPERLMGATAIVMQLCLGAFNIWAMRRFYLKPRAAGTLGIEAMVYLGVSGLLALANVAIIAFVIWLWVNND